MGSISGKPAFPVERGEVATVCCESLGAGGVDDRSVTWRGRFACVCLEENRREKMERCLAGSRPPVAVPGLGRFSVDEALRKALLFASSLSLRLECGMSERTANEGS